MRRRLVRSKQNKVLAGVCGGIAEYFDIDSTIIRLGFLISVFFGGVGIPAYIVALFVMPEGESYTPDNFLNDGIKTEYDPDKDFSTVMGDKDDDIKSDPERNKTFIGVCLIVLGIVFLAKQFVQFDMRYLFPLLLVGIGGLIVFKGGRRMS